MMDSCKIARLDIPYSYDDMMDAIREIVRRNGGDACYIRPVVYRGYKTLGVNPTGVPVDVAIATLNWGKYLGKDALDKGISVRVSSWRRAAPDTFPAMAKTGANYLNGQLIKLEAITDGYQEGIALDSFGFVAEGSGENIFLYREGILHTPTVGSAILPGITRDCVMTLARDLGIEVRESQVPREMLYIADEVFFTGTAAEITPITLIDKIPVGDGKVGEVTRKLQKAFFDIIEGRARDQHRWLFPIAAKGKVQRAAKKAR
jgi:branched-chain amino acid aminotransferase